MGFGVSGSTGTFLALSDAQKNTHHLDGHFSCELAAGITAWQQFSLCAKRP